MSFKSCKITTNLTLEKPKPFLRWAGGKSWLASSIKEYLPHEGFKNYHEIFLGGGSIYFNIRPKKVSFLNDLNKELMETYECVKADVNSIISYLEEFKNDKHFYYSIRESKFKDPSKRAARFIYLNQTSFNGIYRVNLQGKYNVPYGHRKKKFLDAKTLRMASATLANASLTSNDFFDTLINIKKGDLVFIDPPYTVAHNNNGFIKYNQKIFSLDDQYRLADYVIRIKEIGAHYILTNAAHQRIREIFSNGDRMLILSRNSMVGGKNARRGIFNELLLTNIEKQDLGICTE